MFPVCLWGLRRRRDAEGASGDAWGQIPVACRGAGPRRARAAEVRRRQLWIANRNDAAMRLEQTTGRGVSPNKEGAWAGHHVFCLSCQSSVRAAWFGVLQMTPAGGLSSSRSAPSSCVVPAVCVSQGQCRVRGCCCCRERAAAYCARRGRWRRQAEQERRRRRRLFFSSCGWCWRG